MRVTSRERFLAAATPCKIGTVPVLAIIHGGDRKRMAPGVRIRIREDERARWTWALVRSMSPDGHFFADRL